MCQDRAIRAEEYLSYDRSVEFPVAGPAGPRRWAAVLLAAVGAVYPLAATSAECYEVLYSFTGGSEGASPFASLIQATDGNFYGTTYKGGAGSCTGVPTPAEGCGTVFKLDSSGDLTTLHRFAGSDGAWPVAGLIEATDGNFYGTTQQGGNDCGLGQGCGTVFKMDSAANLTTLHSFAGSDGAWPNGLIQASDGNFYGTTNSGGATSHGTVFKMGSDGTLTTLHSFAGGPSEGRSALGGLIQAADGDFYGTTSSGGASGFGTLFKIDSAGSLTTLHSFVLSDGVSPYASLIQTTDGNYYGTTNGGGASHLGTVFRMDSSGDLTTLHSFVGSDGSGPYGSLIREHRGQS